jgi:hypothetical protein
MWGLAEGIIGGNLLSGMLGADASEDAANIQAATGREGIAEQRRQYDLTRADQMPWLEAGRNALATYSGYGPSRIDPNQYIPASNIPQFDVNKLNLYADPSYQFRLNEQNRAINRNAAGMGKFLSGNRLEELMARSGDMASQEYGNMYGRAIQDYGLQTGREADMYNRGVGSYGRAYGQETDYLNRLAGISGTGQSTAAGLGQVGMQTGSNISNSLANIGAAQGAGRIGQASAWQGMLGDMTSLGTMYGMGAFNQPNTWQPGASTNTFSSWYR